MSSKHKRRFVLVVIGFVVVNTFVNVSIRFVTVLGFGYVNIVFGES